MRLTPIAANQTEIETADARIFFSYSTPVAAYILRVLLDWRIFSIA